MDIRSDLSDLFVKIERTTFDVSLVHFLLMFGYKMFSLYYPLFLVASGLSVAKVGWVYFLIYATISVSAIAVNFWIHKIHPAKAASIGIFGYGLYALLMYIKPGEQVFYIAQILLGISASLWLVSLKSIIIASAPKNYNSSFGWFYSAPEYASAIAPLVGGLVIYRFGFEGVFALSVIVQFTNSLYAYFKLKNIEHYPQRPQSEEYSSQTFSLGKWKKNYSAIFLSFKKDTQATTVFGIIFLALILGGIYRAYFVLFLKTLGYSQNEIIGFASVLSLAFIPASWIAIKFIGKSTSLQNISYGMVANGAIFIIMGIFSNILNLFQLFFLSLIETLAALSAGSGKSGFLAEKFAKFKEEASAIDTIIVTLAPALGGIIGGILISAIGYEKTFAFGGSVVFFCAAIFIIIFKKKLA